VYVSIGSLIAISGSNDYIESKVFEDIINMTSDEELQARRTELLNLARAACPAGENSGPTHSVPR
jgi:hypothetical protein